MKKEFVLAVLMLVLYAAKAQKTLCKLTIQVKAFPEQQGLWDSIIITGTDTCYRLGCGRKSVTATIPKGHYVVMLKSRVNSMLKKAVDLKKSATVEFNTLYYYTPYRDTVSIFTRMKEGDTCFINYTAGAGKTPTMEYFMVVKEGQRYATVIKNELNQWWSIQVFEYELQELFQYGKYKGTVATRDHEGLGVYYCSLNRQLLRRDCGVCLYGFLLRKRLLREK